MLEEKARKGTNSVTVCVCVCVSAIFISIGMISEDYTRSSDLQSLLRVQCIGENQVREATGMTLTEH